MGALLILACASQGVRSGQGSFVVGSTGGYGRVLRDRPFLAVCAVSVLTGMVYALVETILPVHSKEGLRLPEAQLGLIMSASATMVVLFQYAVTRITERHPHLRVLAVGALFYAAGVGSVAWAQSFWAVLASMGLLTLGEMISMPTAVALAANLAPPAARGRYMSVYGLNWETAYVIGPMVAGLVHDGMGPVWVWHCGLAMGLVAAAGLYWLERRLLAGGPVTAPLKAVRERIQGGSEVNEDG